MYIQRKYILTEHLHCDYRNTKSFSVTGNLKTCLV